MISCATLTADPVVDIIIDSVPRDAEVFMGKRRLGLTPLMVQLASKGASDETKSFMIYKGGYRSSTITLYTAQNKMLFGNLLFFTTTSGAPSATTDFNTGYAYMFSKRAFVTELRPEIMKASERTSQPEIKRLSQLEREADEKRRREAEAQEAQRKALLAAERARMEAEREAEQARLKAAQAVSDLERERLARAAVAEREQEERARRERELKEQAEREVREREARERAEREVRERAEREVRERAEREVRERAEREERARREEERARLKGEQEALEAELERVRASREALERAREELRLERERFEEERRLIEEERARQSRSRGWRLRPLPRAPQGGASQEPSGEARPEGAPAETSEGREGRLLEQIKARQRALEELDERERGRGATRSGGAIPAFEVAPVEGGAGDAGDAGDAGEQGALPSILSPSWGALALSIESFSALSRALAGGQDDLIRAIYLRMVYARGAAPEWEGYRRFMGCVSDHRAHLAAAPDGLALYRSLESLAFERGVCQGGATARAPYAPRDPSEIGARP